MADDSQFQALREALEHIDRNRCESLVAPHRCFHSNMDDPTQWCDPCTARRALFPTEPTAGLRHLAEWVRERYPFDWDTRADAVPVPRLDVKNLAHQIDVEAATIAAFMAAD